MTFPVLILEGNRLALARLLTQVENDTPIGRQALNDLFPHTGGAHLIGVTGAPGTGKSSLVNRLALLMRRPETGSPRQVAIVAVDPSSPFTGGAILGDRVRMRDLAGDPGVFIRSMASRGNLGGLAVATSGMVQVLDAAGYEVILIETVGAGQAEVDIARLAHTTLVIEAPGLGDDIQAIKAGILEIADVLVVNKADRPGVESTERALRSMLQLAHPAPRVFSNHSSISDTNILDSDGNTQDTQEGKGIWIPPIQRTVATEGAGIADLITIIDQHYVHLKETGDLKNREKARLRSELQSFIHLTLVSRWRESLSAGQYEEILERVVKREISLWQAVEMLVGGE